MNTKYYFWDDGNGLVNHKNVTMTLSWNIIPNAGNLPRFEQKSQLHLKAQLIEAQLQDYVARTAQFLVPWPVHNVASHVIE